MTGPRFVAYISRGPNCLQPDCDPDDRELRLDFRSRALKIWTTADKIDIGDCGILVGHLFSRSLPSRRITRFSQSAVERILASSGECLLREYWGGYVVFLALPDGRARILRDPSGALPAYWRSSPQGIAIGAELGRPPFSRSDGLKVDDDALCLFLWSPHFAGSRTCIEGISELLPGHALDIDGSRCVERRLWSPWDYGHFIRARHRVGVELFRETVLDVVRAWGDCFHSILLGMSGGLDSTIVAAGLAGSDAQVHGMTMFGPDPGSDERPYAAQAAAAFGISNGAFDYQREYIELAAPVVENTPRPFLAHFVQPLASVRDRLWRQHSIDAFFSGNGGDNVFCQLRSVTPVIDRVRSFSNPCAIFKTAMDLARLTNADLFTIARATLVRMLKRRPAVAGISAVGLNAGRLARAIEEIPVHPWLAPEPGILPGTAAHVAMIRRAFGNDGFHSRFTHPPSIAPLLSQPVIELCLNIPTWSWIEDGVDRAVARRAFEGLIPQRLLNRRNGGGPSGFVDQIYRQNEQSIWQQLRAGFLRQHSIIDSVEETLVDAARHGSSTLYPQRVLALVAADAWARRWEGS